MKKNTTRKLLKALLAPIGKGILIFAVFGLAVYTYAITFPGAAPGPVSGVVGTFVGLTENEYASSINSYSDLNELCNSGQINSPTEGTLTNVGAHVCTAMEIQNSYNNNSPVAAAETGLGIINEGPPGYTVYANDCNGWNVRTEEYNNTPAFGAVWYFTDQKSSLVKCDWLADTVGKDFKIACCK